MGTCRDCAHFNIFTGQCKKDGWPKKPDDRCNHFAPLVKTKSVIYTLQEHQSEFLNNHLDMNFVLWPRCSGKTYMAAILAIQKTAKPGKEVLICAPSHQMLGKVFASIFDICKDTELITHSKKSPVATIGLYNQSFIYGISLHHSSTVGAKGINEKDHIIVDDIEYISIDRIRNEIMPIVLGKSCSFSAFCSNNTFGQQYYNKHKRFYAGYKMFRKA